MIRPPTVDLTGQKVRVYRNLNNGQWSVKHPDHQVFHVTAIYLRDVTFYVSGAGRARVRHQQQREVHAWAIGRVVAGPLVSTIHPITYNPYHDRACFIDRHTQAAVYASPYASFETRAGSPQPECYVSAF